MGGCSFADLFPDPLRRSLKARNQIAFVSFYLAFACAALSLAFPPLFLAVVLALGIAALRNFSFARAIFRATRYAA